MRWFKHYNNVSNSDKIQKLLSISGNDGFASWFFLLELLSRKSENISHDLFSPNYIFTLSQKELLASFYINHRKKLEKLLEVFTECHLITYSFSDKFYQIKCPILFDLEGKDSKYDRSRRKNNESKPTLEKEKEKEKEVIKENTNVFSKKAFSDSLFDKVCQDWNEWCHEPFRPVMAFKPDTMRKFFELVRLNPNLQFPENWARCFSEIENCNSLNGKNSAGFVASLQWLIEKEKIVDALNGAYQQSMSEKEILRAKNESVENPYV